VGKAVKVSEQGRTELSIGLLRCPRTGAALRRDGARLVTTDGAHAYPVVAGIPDLRLFDPPYVSRAEEARRVERLAEAATRLDYTGLVEFYETEIMVDQPPDRRRKHIEHRLTLQSRAKRRLHAMLETAKLSPPRCEPGELVLDLGCGSGEAIGELARLTGGGVIGVDISLEELLLGRKLLEEEGVSASLVAACAEALPFADAAFAFVYSPDVVEHVASHDDYLREIHRVLAPRGKTLLNSPNRFSILTAEPHVGIWGLGFLPRPLMDPVCRLAGKGPYIGKKLLSLGELRRSLAGVFGAYSIFGRDSNPNATGFAGRLYHGLSPVSVALFDRVCDQHVVVATKEA
jgi:SAM-dependent methyltransferase